MTLDPTSNIGKLRLRVADYTDIPLLPDSVYHSVLEESQGNLPKAAKTLAMYILGMLAHKTHRKMNQLEVWGQEAFDNYKQFLLLTVSNPNFLDISPIPYSATSETNPLIQFQESWNQNFFQGTEQQQNNFSAVYSPNDGSKFGPMVL